MQLKITPKLYISLACLTTIFSGCAGLNEGLSTVNNGLSTINSALGTVTGTTTNATSASVLAPISAEQKQKIINGLSTSQAQYKGNIANAIGEATPNINQVISFLSCYPSYDAGKYLAQYAAPDYSPFAGLATPLRRMQYHSKSQCVTLNKLQGWKMPANNALRFEAIYISDTSGESIKQTYEIVKQPSGEWLFTSALTY